MLRILPVVAALGMVVGSGVVHGLRTDRWTAGSLFDSAKAKLASIPANVGEWEGQAVELDDRELARAEIATYMMRRYVHARTGNELSVLIVAGPGGPISVHTPDICFAGAGYQMAASPEQYTAPAVDGAAPADFWTAKFRKTEAGMTDQLRIYWSWNATGSWQAPDNPRWTLSRQPVLFKMYVMHRSPGLETAGATDLCPEFFRVFLPVVQESLGGNL